jgi:hypothetical protein
MFFFSVDLEVHLIVLFQTNYIDMASFSFHQHAGPVRPPLEADDILLRVDFVREVDALLKEVRQEQSEEQNVEGFDPESVASKLKQQEKQRTIHKVEALLDLAISLKW